MKKIILVLSVILIFTASPALAATKAAVKTVKPAPYKAVAPAGYTPITWASAPGINSYFKAPSGSGSLDFITRIYLPQNKIKFIISTTSPFDLGPAGKSFVETTTVITKAIEQNNSNPWATNTSRIVTSTIASSTGGYRNLSFFRFGAEVAKKIASEIKFFWDAPFFNMKNNASDLSMAVKYSFGTSTVVSTGSRSVPDLALDRRMLIINNAKGTSSIGVFNGKKFVSAKFGEEALEGFSPSVAKSDSAGGLAARLFLGVSNDGKELVVYCSNGATVGEASAALTAAGVKPENQLEADGGGSASCGYNLPGQYFVEPSRTLPVMMGAVTILYRGTIKDSANVRATPAVKGKLVRKLGKNISVYVYEEKNGWYRIGEKEWVLGTLIKKN